MKSILICVMLFFSHTLFAQSEDEHKLTFSNFFSPNEDGYNDTWSIGNSGYHPNFKLVLYNRWGQIVHTQSKTFVAWDGKAGGAYVPDGVYYLVLIEDETDKDSEAIKGSVTVLK